MMGNFNLKPFDKVLVRSNDSYEWEVDLYGYFNENKKYHACVGGYCDQCIPYNDDTKHLLGTTDPYEEPYEPKDWDAEKKQVVDQQYEPKPGDYVRYDFFSCSWIAIFKKKYGGLDAFHAAVYMKQGPTVLNIDGAFDNKNANRIKATEAEKKQLDDALKASGKVYDQKEGKLVDLKKEFSVGEEICVICYDCSEVKFGYAKSCYSPSLHRFKLERNMIFKTEEEAKLRVQELNKAIFKE